MVIVILSGILILTEAETESFGVCYIARSLMFESAPSVYLFKGSTVNKKVVRNLAVGKLANSTLTVSYNLTVG